MSKIFNGAGVSDLRHAAFEAAYKAQYPGATDAEYASAFRTKGDVYVTGDMQFGFEMFCAALQSPQAEQPFPISDDAFQRIFDESRMPEAKDVLDVRGFQHRLMAAMGAQPSAPQVSQEVELPPLPDPLAKHPLLYGSGQKYTADQMREYGRQCAALSRVPAEQPSAPSLSDAEFRAAFDSVDGAFSLRKFADAVIAQRQHDAQPVGIVVASDPIHGWHMRALKNWEAIGDGTKLYAAPPQQDAQAIRDNALEEAAKVCGEFGSDKFDEYKGRGKHAPNNPNRANNYTQGESDGAEQCAELIRAMKSPQPTPDKEQP